MKKSKIILVTALAFVLCFMCVTSTTFSWFTRPQSKSGDSLQWNPSYVASDGSNISMVTYESTDDGASFSETLPVKNFSSTVAPGKRKYYRTDIINNSSTAQSVSLYLSNLQIDNSNSNFYLGVNGPLKTYKNYSLLTTGLKERKTASTNLFKDVYIGFKHGNSYNYKDYKLWFWGTGYPDSTADIDYYHGTATINGIPYDIYHAQVPYNITNGKIYKGTDTNKDWLGSNNKDNTDLDTQNIFLIDTSTPSVSFASTSKAAGLNTFYSEAYVAVGNNSFDLRATGRGTITYTSSNPSVATIDASGTVTALKAGTTTITVTSTGTLATTGGTIDTQSATCELRVFKPEEADLSSIPIVTNMKIAGGSNGDVTIQSVYWYIKNGATTGDLKYTVGDFYLTS